MRSILIVEDDYLLAMLLEDMVRSQGYHIVGPYRDLKTGLDAANTANVDFGLLDFDLGEGSDSTPIAEALTSRGLPFAFVTGTEPSLVRASFGKSAIVLAKPVDERLLDRVLAAA